MRKFLLLAAALILAAIPTVPAAASPVEDAPTTTPIKHVVWMMQDNHSFDNYFGTYPGADGIPSGVCQRLNINRKSTKGCVQPFRIGNAPIEDLSQGPGVQRRQYNNGQMDGFVAAYRRLGLDGTSAMGYYDGSDIPFHWHAADQYVLFDRFFASTKVGSREAYLYWVAGNAPTGQTPLRNSAGYDTMPTIFDKLAERQITAKFYVENLDQAATGGESGVTRPSQLVKVPLLSMKRFRDGGALAGQVVDLSEYYRDLQKGTLPAVSYIVTTSSSENPPADPSAGSRTLRKVTSELMKSSAWSTSAFMWTYDGWGGWYDHVPPPRVDSRGYGFRVPALLVSPYAKKGVVNHTVLDYTAMLNFIETNWNVEPLSVRDRQSAGLVSAFDFTAPPRPGALLPWAWPAPQVSAADSPAPVIYAVYGVAAALAMALVSLAVYWRGPITVPVLARRGGVLVRSGLGLTQDRMQQALQWLSRARQKWLPVAASRAARVRIKDGSERAVRFADSGPAILTIPSWPRPAPVGAGGDSWVERYHSSDQVWVESRNGHAPASAAPGDIDHVRTEQSKVIPEPDVGNGQTSVEHAESDLTVEVAHNVVLRSFAVRGGESYTASLEADKEQKDPAHGAEPPVAAEPVTNAEAEPVTEAEPAINTQVEPVTDAEAEPVAEATPATEAKGKPATNAEEAGQPATVEAHPLPGYARPVRHQRRRQSRSQRRNLDRR
jgi:phospholipase C